MLKRATSATFKKAPNMKNVIIKSAKYSAKEDTLRLSAMIY